MSIFEFDLTPRYVTVPSNRRWCRICWFGIGLLAGFAGTMVLL